MAYIFDIDITLILIKPTCFASTAHHSSTSNIREFCLIKTQVIMLFIPYLSSNLLKIILCFVIETYCIVVPKISPESLLIRQMHLAITYLMASTLLSMSLSTIISPSNISTLFRTSLWSLYTMPIITPMPIISRSVVTITIHITELLPLLCEVSP